MDNKDANILLISDEDYEYEVLKDAGYKNVKRFTSMLRSYEYFKDEERRSEILDKFDIVLFGSSAIGYRDCGKYRNDCLQYVLENDIPYLSFFSSSYEDKLFYISKPNITSMGVEKERFISILSDVINDECELKGESIELPEITIQEKIIPQRREDVKVLFLGIYIDEEKVEEFFKNEGFTNYTYRRANNFSLDRNIAEFPKYDLVIVDDGFNGAISLFLKDYHDYQKDKDNNTFIGIYKVGNTNLRENTVWGYTTENPEFEKKIKYSSIGSDHEALIQSLKCVLKMYAEYNPNLSGDEYPSEEELNEQYEADYQKLVDEKNRIDKKFMNVREIYNRLFDCRAFLKKGVKIPRVEGLKIDILQDGMSMAFMVGAREAVRVTFKDEDFRRDNDGKIFFYLEYLNSNGKMKTAERHVVSCSYVYPDITDITDEEAKKIDVLTTRITNLLAPKIREINTALAKREKEEREKRNRNHRRPQNKKYMI
ncbi:MAG: hypothetical protein OSJ70_09695 [Bacilli bacterium]|nr:hypothetical protein [Bacilli bacterium]